MSTSYQHHPSHLGRLRQDTDSAGTARLAARAERAASYQPTHRYSRRACCCTAMPAVVAVIPPSDSRPAPTDLLLCGHHYRKSIPALAALGAVMLDLDGYALPSGAWPDSR